MRNIILAGMIWVISISVAHASIITIGTTVQAQGIPDNTSHFTISYNDADEDLLLTMAELMSIDWEQTDSFGTTYMGTSSPDRVTTGGINFQVSADQKLISTSPNYGAFGFYTSLGYIGLQTFNNYMSYWGSCPTASPCGYFSYDTFTVSNQSVVPEPSTFLLMAIGITGLGISSKRKMQA